MLYRTHPVLLSIYSALLLSLAWYWNLSALVFIGFVPLLIIEDKFNKASDTYRYNLKLFGYIYLAFLLWNIAVTWWVMFASFGGACIAFVFNSLFMAIVFIAFSRIRKRVDAKFAIWIIIPLWLGYEYGHTLWDLTWTWLILGNVFAFHPNWVQWYEFTGTSGGTLWILISNVIIFKCIQDLESEGNYKKWILKIAAVLIVPLFFSYLILFFRQNEKRSEKLVNTMIVQPNVDPYNDKFFLDYRSQFLKVLDLLKNRDLSETNYLVLPETFITENLNEETINESEEIEWFRDSLINKYPHLKIITGTNSYEIYKEGESVPASARKDERGFYYDVFNTGIQIDAESLQLYHKSKLVPGVERMPFPALLKPLESLAIDMGGTMGSLGTQPDRTLFKDEKNKIFIAPVICYESIFADYTAEYIRLGANLIFIITNDGWWDKTPGYSHHLNYARLRAIENRREMARCANTGISCFIDELGNISDDTEWWKEAVISKKIVPNNSLTFFSSHGDLISYFASVLSVVIIIWAFYLKFSRK